MFHWCPEETAAVIAAGSAAAYVLVWAKARWFIFVGWLRRKLGLVDERHCCLHVAPNRAGPDGLKVVRNADGSINHFVGHDPRTLTKEEVDESYRAAQKADNVIKATPSCPQCHNEEGLYGLGARCPTCRPVKRAYKPNCGGAYPLDLPPLDPNEKP